MIDRPMYVDKIMKYVPCMWQISCLVVISNLLMSPIHDYIENANKEYFPNCKMAPDRRTGQGPSFMRKNYNLTFLIIFRDSCSNFIPTAKATPK